MEKQQIITELKEWISKVEAFETIQKSREEAVLRQDYEMAFELKREEDALRGTIPKLSDLVKTFEN